MKTVTVLQRGRAFEGAERGWISTLGSSLERLQRGRAFEGAESSPTLEAHKSQGFLRLRERFGFQGTPRD